MDRDVDEQIVRTRADGGSEREHSTQPLPDEAFAAALVKQTAALTAYARRLSGYDADADDLLQDTLLRCWTARHRFEAGTNLEAWTRTVMRNGFLSGRRRARFQAELPEGSLDSLLTVVESQSQAVELQDVQRAIETLAREHREAVLLAAEGVSMKEGAARLAIPEGTFKSRLSHGRDRLRRIEEEDIRSALPGPSKVKQRPRKRRDWRGVLIG